MPQVNEDFMFWLCFAVALVVGFGPCCSSASPFSVLIPPQGVLSIYARSTRNFESAIFPVYVTNYQPAVLVPRRLGRSSSKQNSQPGSKHAHKVEGRLIAAYPNANSNANTSGCSLDAVPPPPYEGDWILLVDNLGCDYATKIQNAGARGFQALVVYSPNSDEPPLVSVDPTQMQAQAPATAVYTSSIGATDGFLLRSLYAYPNDFFVELEENSFVFIDVLYHLMLICFTITSLFVGLLCATWIYDTCKCQRCIERLEEERKQKLLQAFLAKKTIVRQWSADGPFQNNDACIICLEEFGTADQIRVLPCLHVFHISCIDHWTLRVSMCCPICKQYIGTKVEQQQLLAGGGTGSPAQIQSQQQQQQQYEYEYEYHAHDAGSQRQQYGVGESIPLLPLSAHRRVPDVHAPSALPLTAAAASASSSSQAGRDGLRNANSNSSPTPTAMNSLRTTSQSVCALLPSASVPP